MIRNLVQNLGVFLWPQLAISLVAVALVAGYLVSWFRRELEPGERPWETTIEPLAGLATMTGMLGTFCGLVIACGEGIEPSRLLQGLSIAYATSIAGLTTAILAGFGCWLLGVLNRARSSL